MNVGVVNLQAANPAAAEAFFASALTIDPTSKPARDGLAQARSLSAGLHGDVLHSELFAAALVV